MANEFKVKKGLIVDGSNTVLDVQGTSGQLFSVTDSLTGDLFSVSDVSGVPIFNVNSSGMSTFDGDVTIDKDSARLILQDNGTGNALNQWISYRDSAGTERAYLGYGSTTNSVFYVVNNLSDLKFYAGGVLNETKSGANSTFSGNISLADGWTLENVSGGYAKFSDWVKVSNTGIYTTEDMYFDLDDSSSRFVVRGVGNAEIFEIDTSDSNRATFAGDVDVTRSSTGQILSRVYNSNTSGTGTSVLRIANGGNQANGARLEFSDLNYYNATISVDRTNGMRFMVHDDSNSMADLLTHPVLTLATNKKATFAGDLMMLSGTGGTTSKIIFKRTDNTSEATFIRTNAYWNEYGSHANEGHKFIDTSGNILLQLNGGNSNSGNGAKSATFGGSTLAIAGDTPYIKGTGTGAMRIKHTSGQTMYLRPDETGALSIFEGANSQTVYMMTVAPSTNNTQNNSAQLAFQTRSKKSDGTAQSKTAIIQHETYDIGNNYGNLNISGTNKATFSGMDVVTTGNVGIGETSPSGNLDILGATTGVSAHFPLIEATGQNTSQEGIHVTTTGTGNDYYALKIATGSDSNTLMVTNAGRVGIGTASPSYLLEVGSATQTNSNVFSGRVDGDFIFNLSKANTNLFSIRNNSTGIVHLNTQNSAVLALGVSTGTGTGTIVSNLQINSAGLVGIGCDPGPQDGITDNPALVVGDTTGSSQISIISQNNNYGYLLFGDSTAATADRYQGQLRYYHTDDELQLVAGNTVGLKLLSTSATFTGGVIIDDSDGLTVDDKIQIPLALSSGSTVQNFTKGGSTHPSGQAHIQYRNFQDYPSSGDNSKVLDIAATSGKWGVTAHSGSYIRFSTAAADTDTTETLLLGPDNSATFSGNVIIDGTSLSDGDTVLDVQGDDGQLFSVTNSLSGDLFSVSDVSGVPILNVNSSGLVEIDDVLELTNSTSSRIILPDSRMIASKGTDGVENTLLYHNGTRTFLGSATNSAALYVDGDNAQVFGDLTIGGDVIADTYFTSSDSNVALSTDSNGTVFLRPNGKLSSTGQTTFTTTQASFGTSATFAGDVTVTGTYPKIILTDTDNNPDFTIIGGSGQFGIYDETNSTYRLRIDSSGLSRFQSDNTYVIGLLDSGGTDQWWFRAFTNGNFAIHENGVGDKFTIAAGGNATFAGDVTVNGGDITVNTTGKATLTLNGDSDNSGDAAVLDSEIRMLHDAGDYGILLQTQNHAGRSSFKVVEKITTTETMRFQIDETGDATFAGQLTGESYVRSLDTYQITLDAVSSGGPKIEFGATNDWDLYGHLGHQSSEFQFGTHGRDFAWYNSTTRIMELDAGNTSEPVLAIGTSVAADNTKATLQVFGNNNTDGTVRLGPHSSKGSNFSHIHYGSNGDWYIRPASNSGSVNVLNYVAESDARLKENIVDNEYGLNEISQLKSRNFNWISSPTDKQQTGFIAQEVEEVVSKWVTQGQGENNYKAVDYQAITSTLVKAVQELKAQNEDLLNRVKALESK